MDDEKTPESNNGLVMMFSFILTYKIPEEQNKTSREVALFHRNVEFHQSMFVTVSSKLIDFEK